METEERFAVHDETPEAAVAQGVGQGTLEVAGQPRPADGGGPAIAYELGRGLDIGTANLASSIQDTEGNVSFRWAFGAIVGPEENQRLIPITRDTELEPGNRLKMLLELEKKCFVYVFYRGPENELQMLFPSDFNQFETDYEVSRSYYIPSGNTWLELDDSAGSERFYLMASSQRLTELETLYGEYEKAPKEKHLELAKSVISKIREIKMQHKKFASIAERPVSIGGNVRALGIGLDAYLLQLSAMSVDISADSFFGRTFTIDRK